MAYQRRKSKKPRCVAEGDPDPLFSQIGRDLSIECLVRVSPLYYGALAQISRGFRSLIKSGEIYRRRSQYGIQDHWLYFYDFNHYLPNCLSSDRTWLAYDPNHNRWISMMTGKKKKDTFKLYCMPLAVGTEFLLFRTHSKITPRVVMKYSMLTHSWSHGIAMNSPRSRFASACLGRKAIVAGGVDLEGNTSTCAELYDSEKETWVPLPSMNKPRQDSSGVFMDGKFYIIGGLSTNSLLTCGEEYDLEKRVWKVIPNMADCHNCGRGRAYPMVAVVRDELYAVDYPQKEVLKFDKKNKSWITLGGLPDSCTLGMSLQACGERLILICGQTKIHSWIPDEEPPVWDRIAQKTFPNFFWCAVMGG